MQTIPRLSKSSELWSAWFLQNQFPDLSKCQWMFSKKDNKSALKITSIYLQPELICSIYVNELREGPKQTKTLISSKNQHHVYIRCQNRIIWPYSEAPPHCYSCFFYMILIVNANIHPLNLELCLTKHLKICVRFICYYVSFLQHVEVIIWEFFHIKVPFFVCDLRTSIHFIIYVSSFFKFSLWNMFQAPTYILVIPKDHPE